MQGGGAGPPAAGPPQPPARGFKKGSANVKGKGKTSKGDGQTAGLEELLAALSAGGGGPSMPMAVPGFAQGGDVDLTPVIPPLMPMILPPPPDTRYAQGTPSVPFGANYQLGAHTVPGQGTGKSIRCQPCWHRTRQSQPGGRGHARAWSHRGAERPWREADGDATRRPLMLGLELNDP